MSKESGSRETGSEETVRVTVDQAACIGSGSCELLEEATFVLDEDTGIAAIEGAGELPLARAQIVIDRCPSSAISIVTSIATE